MLGGPDLTFNGGSFDAFVARIISGGTALSYGGFIGGSGFDVGYGITLDSAANAYVTGYTGSSEASFPVIGGPDLTYNGSWGDPFVAKISEGPLLSSIKSKQGTPGASATLKGDGFSPTKSSNTVYFGKKTATISSATKLKVTIPSKLKHGKTVGVYVVVNGVPSSVVSFKVK